MIRTNGGGGGAGVSGGRGPVFGFSSAKRAGQYDTDMNRTTVTMILDKEEAMRRARNVAVKREALFPGPPTTSTFSIAPGELLYSMSRTDNGHRKLSHAVVDSSSGNPLVLSCLNGLGSVDSSAGPGFGISDRGYQLLKMYENIEFHGIALDYASVETADRGPGKITLQGIISAGKAHTVIGRGGCRVNDALHWMIPSKPIAGTSRYVLQLVNRQTFIKALLEIEGIGDEISSNPPTARFRSTAVSKAIDFFTSLSDIQVSAVGGDRIDPQQIERLLLDASAAFEALTGKTFVGYANNTASEGEPITIRLK
jgi:hypothetical protein